MTVSGQRVCVTGVTGFIGRHVTELLAKENAEVIGVARSLGPPVPGEAARVAASIFDGDLLAEGLTRLRPDLVIHLAGVVPGTSKGVSGLFHGNVCGTSSLFEVLRRAPTVGRVVVASSSAVYGDWGSTPVNETAPLQPTTPYGMSKAAQELVTMEYEALGQVAIRARLFNLIGPGQPASLVLSHLARGVARAEKSGSGTVPIGNPAPRRDFVDVRDAARALVMLAAARTDLSGAYNVASGKSWSIRECCEAMAASAACDVQFEETPALHRALDLSDQRGDGSRLHLSTGWSPEISFSKSVVDLLDDWRGRIARGSP